MKRITTVVLISLLLAVTLAADGPMTGIFEAADRVATDIPRNVPGDGDLLLGGISFNQMSVSLGDLFADLAANRLTGRNDFGANVVKWHLNPAYPPARATWILSGTIYPAGSGYLLTMQLVENSSGSQVVGWEFGLSEGDLEGLLGPSVMASAGSWDSFEPNNSSAEAVAIDLPFQVDGLRLADGDEDWFSFDIPASSGNMVMMLRAATGGATDTYLELYSPEDLSWPTVEDDDTDGGNAVIEMPLTTPGTWYLKVRAFDAATEGEYSLTIDVSETTLGPGEPDEGPEAATTLNVGQRPIDKRIDYTGDEDWFRIVLTRPLGSDEVLRVETLGDGDTVLNLLDEYEGFILSDDDSGADSNAMVMVSGLGAGTYYAVVSGYEGARVEYSILANVTVPVRDEYEDDPSISQASRISVGESQRRNFSPVGDVDWVRFSITEAGYYRVGTRGSLDTYIELHDSSGNLMEENDDAEDYNATIERSLETGDYFVMVTPYGNASPDDIYTLYLEGPE